jgi:hypothetical protein
MMHPNQRKKACLCDHPFHSDPAANQKVVHPYPMDEVIRMIMDGLGHSTTTTTSALWCKSMTQIMSLSFLRTASARSVTERSRLTARQTRSRELAIQLPTTMTKLRIGRRERKYSHFGYCNKASLKKNDGYDFD